MPFADPIKAKDYQKKWYEENKDKFKEYGKKYYKENREKVLECKRKWREENKDEIKEYNKRYNEENKEYNKEYQQRYYEENKDKSKEKDKKYREENKDKIKEKNKRYGEENRPKRILTSIRCRARKLGIPFDLTVEDIASYNTCPVFGFKMERGSKNIKTSPSVDRIIPELGYVKGNIQVISNKANTMKNDATPEELRMFAKWVLKTFPEEPDDQT